MLHRRTGGIRCGSCRSCRFREEKVSQPHLFRGCRHGHRLSSGCHEGHTSLFSAAEDAIDNVTHIQHRFRTNNFAARKTNHTNTNVYNTHCCCGSDCAARCACYLLGSWPSICSNGQSCLPHSHNCASPPERR